MSSGHVAAAGGHAEQSREGLPMTARLAHWRAVGACLSADPEIFFPVSGTVATAPQVAEARRICAGCPVRGECLDFAMRTGEAHGIWGGTTQEERSRARRAAAARRSQASWACQEPAGMDGKSASPRAC
jgi:WhiB family transcriptional regulator, redox-sensing transcriptional regulator